MSYFFDLIEIEIHATNIASFNSVKPIQESFVNRIIFKNKITNDASNHLKFCCKLIDSGIDKEELNKKYRNVDDLPIV